MKKICYILFLTLLSLSFVTGCDDLDDVNAKEAPDGKLNVDVSGKTFSKTEPYDKYTITKTETTYDADGYTVSEETSDIILTKKVTTLEFSDDNTYTLTVDIQFADSFDALYNWDHVPSADRNGTTYTTYEDYDNNWYYIMDTFDRPFYSPDGVDNGEDPAPAEGDKMGDQSGAEYSNYAGETYKKTVYTGEWAKAYRPTDGFEDTTRRYTTLLTQVETTNFMNANSPDDLPDDYMELYSTSTDTSWADTSVTVESGPWYNKTTEEGKTEYGFYFSGVGDVNLELEDE